MDLREVCCDAGNWIDPAQDNRPAYVRVVMNLQVQNIKSMVNLPLLNAYCSS